MATENMFIASGIMTTATLGVLLYLYHHTDYEDKIWKSAWLSGIFMVLVFSYHVLYIGFKNIIVHAGLGSATWSILHILMYGLYAILGWLFLNLFLMLLRRGYEVITGRGYGKAQKTDLG